MKISCLRGLIGHSRNSPTYTHMRTQTHTEKQTEAQSSVCEESVWLDVEIRWTSRRSPDLLITLHVFHYVSVSVLCLHLQIYVVIKSHNKSSEWRVARTFYTKINLRVFHQVLTFLYGFWKFKLYLSYFLNHMHVTKH